MSGQAMDNITGDWSKRKNIALDTLLSILDLLETIRRGTLRWAGDACKNQNYLIRVVIEQNPLGKGS